MGVENLPQIRRKSIEVKTWGEFRKAVEGWRCGDADYCPDCYETRNAQYKNAGGSDLKSHTLPFDDEAIKARAVADGWLVECEDCGKSVFRPMAKTTQ